MSRTVNSQVFQLLEDIELCIRYEVSAIIRKGTQVEMLSKETYGMYRVLYSKQLANEHPYEIIFYVHESKLKPL